MSRYSELVKTDVRWYMTPSQLQWKVDSPLFKAKYADL